MTAAQRQEHLIGEYSLIPDPRERFQLIVETAAAGNPPFPEEGRREENLVPGCVSRLWLLVRFPDKDTVEVRAESESPALNGIAALFQRIYSGATPEEVLATEPLFIERLALDRLLTPTRLRGLRRLRGEIVARTKAPARSAGS